MWTLGSLSFAAPWALAALLALPALLWLLRITPPTPLRVVFPPLRLLLGLTAREETAAKSPLWLILLRVALAVAVIFGLSDPVLNAARGLGGQGPVIIVVDDGWAAARNWTGRQAAMAGLLDQAAREGRPVLLTGTAPTGGAVPDLQVTRAEEARSRALALELAPEVRVNGVSPGAILWPEDGEAFRPGSVLYYAVDDLPAAYRTLVDRGVAFAQGPHLVARMPDHELWMAFLDDSEGNVVALMSEVRSPR